MVVGKPNCLAIWLGVTERADGFNLLDGGLLERQPQAITSHSPEVSRESSKSVLIADDVALGRTIEAAYILRAARTH